AAEEEPRRGRADPRQERPALRQSRGRADDDEGPAALVQLRPAGGQGALLRLGGHAGGRARRAATAAGLADLPHRSHARRRRRALRHRHRPRRLSRPQGPALPPGSRRGRQGRASGARARRRARGAAARGAARVLAAHRGRRPRRPDGGGLAAGARGHGRHRARRRAEGARRGTRARRLVSAGRRRAAALTAAALAVLALDACGRRGSPLPPEIRIPQAVSDLTAVEREGGIEVAWTVPSRRVDNSRILEPGIARLYRVDDTGAGEPRPAMLHRDRVAGYTEIATFLLQGPAPSSLRGNRITYVDRQNLAYGRRYTYVATTADASGRTSPPSARVSITYIAAPEAPQALRGEGGDHAARLTWQPPAKLADGTPVTDPLAYEVLRAGNVAALPSRGEVRRSWRPRREPDVAAYIVYRRAGGAPATRVGSVRPPTTTFVDRNVPPGTYRYTVTAQDASARANESRPSTEVTVTVP